MASELEDLGRRLLGEGYPEGGTLVTTLARSLRGLHLIPPHLPNQDAGRLDRYRTHKVQLDVPRLREQRCMRKLSQRGLALTARLSASYVCNAEARTGTMRVRWSTVAALAAALEVAPETLVRDREAGS